MPSGPRKLAYLIPEFPGQTHVLFWREILVMREWGVDVRIVSTRTPPDRDKARHAFADAARKETFYLWPMPLGVIVSCLLWGLFCHPIGLARALKLALTLPVDRSGKRKQRVVPLLLPALRLARQLKAENITHVHAHTCAAGAILCMMAKRLIGSTYSMTLHANIEWWGGAMKEKFEDAAFTLVITDKLMKQIDAQFPTLRTDQKAIGRMGCDTRKWTPEMPADTDGASSLRLFSLSRLHHSKGHATFFAALQQLRAEGLDFTLRLGGDGPQRAELEKLAADLGLADRITFLGSLSEDEAIAHMRRSDVFVLASLAEPLGVVYMEAMSTEVATIGTAAGGVAEIITPGVDGLLVPPQDAPALAAAIRSLADDANFRRRLAVAGRQTIVARFDSRVGAGELYRGVFHVEHST